MRRLATATGVLWVATAACSTFEAVKASDAGAVDASVTGREDAGGEALPDASEPLDSGRRPCPDAALCHDFDEATLGKLWSSYSEQGAVLRLVTDGARSVPNALLAETTSPPGGVRFAHLQKKLPPVKTIACEFDFQL